MTGDYGDFRIVHAARIHVPFIASNLRKQDLEEVPDGVTPYQALMQGVEDGVAYTIKRGDTPIGMMGMSKVTGYPILWMVATPDVRKIRRSLITQGKYFINLLLGSNECGGNYVHDKNYNSIRWLMKMGATFGSPIEVDGKNFIPFRLEKCVLYQQR